MEKITLEQFMLRQPAYPEVSSTDRYYLDVANRLLSIAADEHLFEAWPENVVREAALCVTGYYQDVIADAGIWHGFIDECMRLFGKKLPFYTVGDGYTDYELNREDVRFMVWYTFTMVCEEKRIFDPMNDALLKGADRWYGYLDSIYEDAPIPADFRPAHELEITDPEDHELIMTLGNWLYLHCYLLTPANALTLREIISDPAVSKDETREELRRRLHQAMGEFPTGPLALYLREWLYLTIEDRMPPISGAGGKEKDEHPYYTAFVSATGGKQIQYIATYEELNRFFIEKLGWKEGEEHLPRLKGQRDFVLLVNPEKGMLLARGVARCIADPENPLYDRQYAYDHAMELLTIRGLCPGDLLRYVCERGWLADARFPGSDDTELPAREWQFIGRCYLQQYFRGD